MRRFLAIILASIPSVLLADEVVLRNGGRLSGVVVEDSPTRVVIEIGPGRVTVARDRVLKVVSSASALDEYRRRASAAGADVAAWASLARWAEDKRLQTQASQAWERVLRLDPRNADAHLGLGHVQVAGRWLEEDDAYRARGYVRFEGRWTTPSERDATLADRRAAADAETVRAERDARLREAEARARAAEADARAAEANATTPPDGGIPLGVVTSNPWGYGGYGPYGYPYPPPSRPRPVVVVVTPPAPAPTPTPAPQGPHGPRPRSPHHP